MFLKQSSLRVSSMRLGGWLWTIPIVTAGLGTWQVRRRNWKMDLIQKSTDRLSCDPVELPQTSTTSDLQFLRVKTRGQFVHDQEMLIGPRTRNDQETQSGGLFGSGSHVGYYVFTPFVTENGQKILVNRGWIPRENKEPGKRRNGQIQGMVPIEGVLREGEDTSALAAPNKPEVGQWFSIDLDKMSQVTGSTKTLVELVADSKVNQEHVHSESPILRNPRINFRNTHLQYAITWYGLCAFSTLMLLRNRRLHR